MSARRKPVKLALKPIADECNECGGTGQCQQLCENCREAAHHGQLEQEERVLRLQQVRGARQRAAPEWRIRTLRLPVRRVRSLTRKRPLVHLSLSPDAIARLAEIATRCGETRSGVVERLIREAEMPRPRTAGATRT